jgi:CDP-diacylglycerol--serine O-phosphatidyltransferase
MSLKDRLADPRFPDRRPRRAAYALPTLFTAGNIFLGYIAILRSFRGALEFSAHGGAEQAAAQFVIAAQAIGAAFVLDGLDGRIARLTNTTSDFGREMDSLADVISFGLAPAILAFAWGIYFVDVSLGEGLARHLRDIGGFISFLFLICGSLRLARFNVQKNPIPKNPGKPDRKYFVGMPIPAAAGMVAAVVYASSGEPLVYWPFCLAWLALLALLAFLMVSTWRYHSFKGVNLSKAYSPLLILLVAAFIYAIWNYGKPVLLVIASAYVASGIAIRVGGIVRRRVVRVPGRVPPPQEHGVG